MVESRKPCIFVMGMHRSGTSALTGVLHLLGCDLGTHLMGPWKGDNPKGFFENDTVFRRNEKFLDECGSSWDDPFLYGPDWLSDKETGQYKSDIARLFRQEFEDNPVFVIKDPRICILYPAWKEVLEELGLDISCIIAIRNPWEVAGSLNRRDGFSTERGLLMWMNHMLTAELLTRERARVFVSYDELLDKPLEVVGTIIQKLNISFPRSLEAAGEKITEFLERDLRHHHEEKTYEQGIRKIVQEYYNLLLGAVSLSGTGEGFIEKADALRREYEDLFLFYYNKDFTGSSSNFRQLQEIKKELVDKTQQYEAMQKRVLSLEGEVRERDLLVAERTEKVHELHKLIREMKETKAWRMAEYFRKKKKGFSR